MQKPIHALARAVIIKNEQILLCVNEKSKFYFLPGGHVETGESTAAALERELQEELDVVCTVQRFLGCFEYSFVPHQPDKCHSHEYNFLFLTEALGLSPDLVPQSPEDHTTFAWVPLTALPQIDFRPAALRPLLVEWLVREYAQAFATHLEK